MKLNQNLSEEGVKLPNVLLIQKHVRENIIKVFW